MSRLILMASAASALRLGARLPRSAMRAAPRGALSMDAKTVVVTGASRGIGAAIAKDLGAQGCNVVVNYAASEGPARVAAWFIVLGARRGGFVQFSTNSADVGQNAGAERQLILAVVEAIKASGGDAIAIKANMADAGEVKELFKASAEKFGPCDVLVNNAGITKDGLAMRMKPAQWQDVIDINLSGVFYCSQAAFGQMAKKRSGRIINMSSVVGLFGNPGQANYASAKGGVNGLTMSNAKEFAGRGVTVNAICPGFIGTEMAAELGEEMLAKVTEAIPLGRLGEPEEVAGLVRYLALDPSAGYITGHSLTIDGGIAIGAGF